MFLLIIIIGVFLGTTGAALGLSKNGRDKSNRAHLFVKITYYLCHPQNDKFFKGFYFEQQNNLFVGFIPGVSLDAYVRAVSGIP